MELKYLKNTATEPHLIDAVRSPDTHRAHRMVGIEHIELA